MPLAMSNCLVLEGGPLWKDGKCRLREQVSNTSLFTAGFNSIRDYPVGRK